MPNPNDPVTENERISGFICRCGEGNLAAAKELIEEVRTLLQGNGEPISDYDLFDNIVWSLNIDFSAHITSISTDQWHGIGVEQYHRGDDPYFSVYMQCDHLVEGLAGIWKEFYTRFPAKFDEPLEVNE